MDKKTAGLALGAGLGAGLAWYFLNQSRGPVFLDIVLEPRPGGGCRVAQKPRFAELHLNQKITWRVTNHSDLDVRVALERWRDQQQNGNSVAPAAISEDEPGDPQPGLWRKVKPHQTASIKGRARLTGNLLGEFVYYDVYLDDEKGADPIVKLVL